MTAGMVRWGGIAVFIGVALVVLFPFVMIAFVGLQGLQAGAGGVAAASVAARTISSVVNIVMLAIMVYVFFATKSYFNALSYRRANIPIYIIIGVQLVSAVLGLIMNTGAGMASLIQTGNTKALGIVVFILLITILVFFVALLIFAIFSIGFGNVGGGVWKAVGILYLIALIGIIAGVLVIGISVAAAGGGGLRAVPSGVAIGGMVLVVVAILCYAAAIICHGIGLVLGAGRMTRLRNPADAF